MSALKQLRIFLSYGHDHNAPLVEMIKTDLEKRGHDVWFDKTPETGKGIKAGDDWRHSITEGLVNSDKVISFLSKYSTRDPGVCRDEIAIAIGVKGGNIKTILVESENEVNPPVNIGHIQWLDMHNWNNKHELGGKEWEDWYNEKLADIIHVIESDESVRFAGEIEKLEQLLKPIQSHARINELLNRGFIGREWLFQKVEDWRNETSEKSRVFVLLAGAGVGKSAFAAHLAYYKSDIVVAAHFCEWNKPTHSDAIATVKSIAFQLATKFPDYRKYLFTLPDIDNLDKQNAAELFSYLLANPLRFCIDGGRQPCVILIDAVDEANTENKQNELISLIANEFQRMPRWLSLLVTSRPENEVLAQLSKFNPRTIDAGAEENMADIRLFLQDKLSRYEISLREKAIESIVQKSEGNFLYAVEICNDIHNKGIDINHPEHFPAGMGNLFINSFNRKFTGINYNTKIAPVLEILISAMEPISVEHVCKLLDIKKRELNDVLLKTGSFFPVTDGKIKPFHKSMIDWLGNREVSERFYIDLDDAEKSMAEAHATIIDGIFNMPEAVENTDEYALRFALVHVYKSKMKGVLKKQILQIFDADDTMYETFTPALNNLVDWVVKNKKAENEQLLKSTFNEIIKSTENKNRLSIYFNQIGNAYKNIGFSIWALEFFEKDMKVMEELVGKEPDRSDFKSDLSVSFINVGGIYKAMGQGPKALEFFEKTLKIMEELVAIEPERTDFRTGLSISFNYIGYMYKAMGLGPKALEFFEKSLKVMEELVTQEPDRTDFRSNLSISFNNVGYVYEAMGQGAKALEFYEKSLKVKEELVAEEPKRTDFRSGLSVGFINMGNIYKAMGQGAKALEFYEKSLKVMEELVAKEPDRTDFRRILSFSLNNVGNIYEAMGLGAKALEFYEKSMKVMEELVTQEPDRTDFRSDLSGSFNNVGYVYEAMGQGAKALEFYEKSLKVIEELVANEPDRTDFKSDLSVIFNNVGKIYRDMDQGPKALEFFEKSLKVREELVAKEPDRTDFRSELSVIFNNVGKIYRDMGQGPKALEFFEKSLKIREELVANEPDRTDFRSELSVIFNNVGKIYRDMGQGPKALEFYEKSLKVREELVAKEPERNDFRRKLSFSLNNVGNIYEAMGQGVKALESFEKSLKVMEELVAKEPDRTDFQVDYAICHWKIYWVCSSQQNHLALTKAKAILEPLIENGITHGQLEELWEKVNKAINQQKQ